VDILNAAAAFARVEERFVGSALAATDAASWVCVGARLAYCIRCDGVFSGKLIEYSVNHVVFVCRQRSIGEEVGVVVHGWRSTCREDLS